MLTPRGLEVLETVNGLLIGLEVYSVFVNYTWPRGVIDSQLSLTWPRSAIAFSFANFSTWSSGAMDDQLSLDWLRSAIAPRNTAPSLIGICRIQWCCLLFLFSTGNTLFGQIWYKNQNYHFKLNLVATLIRIWSIQWCCSLFSFLTRNTLFRQIWSKMSELSV